MTSEVSMVQGSVEYLYADIRADRTLNTQAISLSVSPDKDADGWVSATWVGTPGKFRSARILLNSSLLARGTYNVFARITDVPEAPIIPVGRLKII